MAIDIKDQPKRSYHDFDITDDLGDNFPNVDDWRCRESRDWPYMLVVCGLWALVFAVAIWGTPW